MTTTESTYAVEEISIELEQGDTELEECRELPEREYRDTYYTAPAYPLSVARLQPWRVSAVVRENANRATRLGYRHRIIDRSEWEDDIHSIRASKRIRQGRPMPRAYLERESYSSDWPLSECRRHATVVHGVVSADERLRAYCQLVQCGEVVRFNTILGHAGALEDRVVWLLVREALRWHIDVCDAAFALYFTHDSGHGDGLRYFKERFGFRPARVEWRFA